MKYFSSSFLALYCYPFISFLIFWGEDQLHKEKNYTFIKLCFLNGPKNQLKFTDNLTGVSNLKIQILRPLFCLKIWVTYWIILRIKDISPAISPKFGLRKYVQ